MTEMILRELRSGDYFVTYVIEPGDSLKIQEMKRQEALLRLRKLQ